MEQTVDLSDYDLESAYASPIEVTPRKQIQSTIEEGELTPEIKSRLDEASRYNIPMAINAATGEEEPLPPKVAKPKLTEGNTVDLSDYDLTGTDDENTVDLSDYNIEPGKPSWLEDYAKETWIAAKQQYSPIGQEIKDIVTQPYRDYVAEKMQENPDMATDTVIKLEKTKDGLMRHVRDKDGKIRIEKVDKPNLEELAKMVGTTALGAVSFLAGLATAVVNRRGAGKSWDDSVKRAEEVSDYINTLPASLYYDTKRQLNNIGLAEGRKIPYEKSQKEAQEWMIKNMQPGIGGRAFIGTAMTPFEIIDKAIWENRGEYYANKPGLTEKERADIRAKNKVYGWLSIIFAGKATKTAAKLSELGKKTPPPGGKGMPGETTEGMQPPPPPGTPPPQPPLTPPPLPQPKVPLRTAAERQDFINTIYNPEVRQAELNRIWREHNEAMDAPVKEPTQMEQHLADLEDIKKEADHSERVIVGELQHKLRQQQEIFKEQHPEQVSIENRVKEESAKLGEAELVKEQELFDKDPAAYLKLREEQQGIVQFEDYFNEVAKDYNLSPDRIDTILEGKDLFPFEQELLDRTNADYPNVLSKARQAAMDRFNPARERPKPIEKTLAEQRQDAINEIWNELEKEASDMAEADNVADTYGEFGKPSKIESDTGKPTKFSYKGLTINEKINRNIPLTKKEIAQHKKDIKIADAKRRLQGLGQGLNMRLFDPQIYADLLRVGIHEIGKGLKDFGPWAKRLILDYGEGIRPILGKLWEDVKALSGSELGGYISDKAREAEFQKLANRIDAGDPSVISDIKNAVSKYGAEVSQDRILNKVTSPYTEGFKKIEPDVNRALGNATHAEMAKLVEEQRKLREAGLKKGEKPEPASSVPAGGRVAQLKGIDPNNANLRRRAVVADALGGNSSKLTEAISLVDDAIDSHTESLSKLKEIAPSAKTKSPAIYDNITKDIKWNTQQARALDAIAKQLETKKAAYVKTFKFDAVDNIKYLHMGIDPKTARESLNATIAATERAANVEPGTFQEMIGLSLFDAMGGKYGIMPETIKDKYASKYPAVGEIIDSLLNREINSNRGTYEAMRFNNKLNVDRVARDEAYRVMGQSAFLDRLSANHKNLSPEAKEAFGRIKVEMKKYRDNQINEAKLDLNEYIDRTSKYTKAEKDLLKERVHTLNPNNVIDKFVANKIKLMQDMGHVEYYLPQQRTGKNIVGIVNENGQPLFTKGFDGLLSKRKAKEFFSQLQNGDYTQITEWFKGLNVDMPIDLKTALDNKTFKVYNKANEVSPFDLNIGADMPLVQSVINKIAMQQLKGEHNEIMQAILEESLNWYRKQGWGSHYIKRSTDAFSDIVGGVPGWDYGSKATHQRVINYMLGYHSARAKWKASKTVYGAMADIVSKGKMSKNLYKELSKYVEYSFSNADFRSSKVANSIAVYRLFLKISSVIANATQNLTTGTAALISHGINPGYLYKAWFDLAADKPLNMLSFSDKKAIVELMKSGEGMSVLMNELFGTSKVIDVGMIPFKWVEAKVNRLPAFLAAFRHYNGKMKLPFNESVSKSTEVMLEGHFWISRYNRPRILRGAIGRPVGSLTGFTTHFFKTLNKYVRHNQYKALFYLLASGMALSGTGFIGGDLGLLGLKKAYHATTGNDLETKFRDWIPNHFLQSLFEGGFLGAIGLPSLAKSVQVGISEDPLRNIAAMGIIQDLMDAQKLFEKGDNEAALPLLFPGGARDVSQGLRGLEGIETRGGMKITDSEGEPIKLTGREMGMRILGLTSSRITKEYTIARMIRTITDERSKALQKFSTAYVNAATDDEQNKVMDELDKYNEVLDDKLDKETGRLSSERLRLLHITQGELKQSIASKEQSWERRLGSKKTREFRSIYRGD